MSRFALHKSGWRGLITEAPIAEPRVLQLIVKDRNGNAELRPHAQRQVNGREFPAAVFAKCAHIMVVRPANNYRRAACSPAERPTDMTPRPMFRLRNNSCALQLGVGNSISEIVVPCASPGVV
jgi:hypothetical protein